MIFFPLTKLIHIDFHVKADFYNHERNAHSSNKICKLYDLSSAKGLSVKGYYF